MKAMNTLVNAEIEFSQVIQSLSKIKFVDFLIEIIPEDSKQMAALDNKWERTRNKICSVMT